MERVSVLMDGELDDEEARLELRRLNEDAESRRAWSTYHLVGDALRGETLLSEGFEARFRAALEAEPTVLAPRRQGVSRRIRFVALSAAASIAGVAAVAWLALVGQSGPGLQTGIQVADNGSVQLVRENQPYEKAGEPLAGQVDAAVAEYLLAHQQYSPTPVMSGAVSFIRTVGADEGDLSR
jgi:sigma-E factor negative regulatory protein RseA